MVKIMQIQNKKEDNIDIGAEILKSIEILVNRKIENYKADCTFASVIKQKNTNGTYVILDSSGGERTVKCCIPNLTLNVGQRVWVKMPMGKLSGIHICGMV